MIPKVDVAIVGGGPAGAAAAICAAGAGLHVILFDGERKEGGRPGETLPPGAETLFRRLGVEQTINAVAAVRHDGHWVQHRKSRQFMRFGGDRNGPWLGYQVNRNQLRQILIDRAKDTGVLVQNMRALRPLSKGQAVIGVKTAAGSVMSRLVIDASGSSHWLARARSDLIEYASSQLIAWYGWAQSHRASDFARPIFATSAAEWSWIAQVDDSLCAWVRLDFSPARVGRLPPPRQLKDFKHLARPRGADVTWRIVARQGGEGFLCVGDAAAVLDPASSHGVVRALLTGMAAAQHAVRVIRLGYSDQTEVAAFERWTRATFSRDAQTLRALQQPAVSIGRTSSGPPLRFDRSSLDSPQARPMTSDRISRWRRSRAHDDDARMDVLTSIGASKTTPLSFTGAYRFQSYRRAKPGSLRGLIIEQADCLSLFDINRCLHGHERWQGEAEVNLKAAAVLQRTGIFECHADALYYARNFDDIAKSPVEHDLLDVTKLSTLFAERLPLLQSIFAPDAFDWVLDIIGEMHRTMVNEYMCHEGGHCLGYPVKDKYESGFFRFGGRLRWPLIYMEEYRADANSWSIAARLLKPRAAAAVVLYTLTHRFGLAAENLRYGRPGAGYIPFFHFLSFAERGALVVAQTDLGPRLAFAVHDSDRILECAQMVAKSIDHEINSHEVREDHEECAEASLSFAAARLQNDLAAELFRVVLAPDGIEPRGANVPSRSEI